MTVPAANTPETTEEPAESGALTRLRLGTNTLKALIVNGKPLVALSEGGLYVDRPLRARRSPMSSRGIRRMSSARLT